MRIDDRKVNGRITIEPGDIVDGLKITVLTGAIELVDQV